MTNFCRENQGQSALIGMTMMANPLALEMEDCAAYIPSSPEQSKVERVQVVEGQGEGGHSLQLFDEQGYTIVGSTLDHSQPALDCHDSHGYEEIPL